MPAGEQTKDERFYRQEEARRRPGGGLWCFFSRVCFQCSIQEAEMTGVEELLLAVDAVAMWGGSQGFKVWDKSVGLRGLVFDN